MTYRRTYPLALDDFLSTGASQTLVEGERLSDADKIWASGWLQWTGSTGQSPRYTIRAYYEGSSYGHLLVSGLTLGTASRFELELDPRGASRLTIQATSGPTTATGFGIRDGVMVVSHD